MNIYKLLSTEERIRILEDILYKEELLGVSDVAERLNLSKGLVSMFFDILVEERILEKTGIKFKVLKNIEVTTLKILLNLNSFDTNVLEKFKFVKGVGLYGSFIKGENTEESDIDIYVLIKDTSEENLAKLTKELKRKNAKINPLYLTEDKLRTLEKEDTVFYHSLIFGSINIYGKGIEEIEL